MIEDKSLFSESVIKSIPWVLVSKAFLLFVYFSISVITVRFLGVDEYGVYAICKSIAEILIVVCTLGLTASYMRFIPELVIHRNKAGLVRLLVKSSILQLVAVLVVVLLLVVFEPHVVNLFSTNFGYALVFTGVLIFFELIKMNINAIFTALYQLKTLAKFSIVHGVTWLAMLLALLLFWNSAASALVAPAMSYAVIYFFAGVTIVRYLRSLNWQSPEYGIGRQRVFKHSSSIAVSTLMRLLMLKYTEIFFLGAQRDAATAGIYDLAYSIPLMIIVFIPAALQDLFVSGFSEAYVKDNDCLRYLVRSFYKILIVLAVPIAIFGMYYSPILINIIYGEEVASAGAVASVFCLIHLLPLISIPLSMAIQAKEKVLNMLPTLALQLTINILLDYLLIVIFDLGLWGAVLAVFLTFVLTIPFRLYMVKKIIGGIYFPGLFFLKVLSVSLIVGYVIYFNFIDPSFLQVLLLAMVYLLSIFLICLSPFILTAEDKKDFNRMSMGKLDSVIFNIKYRLTIFFQRQR